MTARRTCLCWLPLCSRVARAKISATSSSLASSATISRSSFLRSVWYAGCSRAGFRVGRMCAVPGNVVFCVAAPGDALAVAGLEALPGVVFCVAALGDALAVAGLEALAAGLDADAGLAAADDKRPDPNPHGGILREALADFGRVTTGYTFGSYTFFLRSTSVFCSAMRRRMFATCLAWNARDGSAARCAARFSLSRLDKAMDLGDDVNVVTPARFLRFRSLMRRAASRTSRNASISARRNGAPTALLGGLVSTVDFTP